VEFRILGPLEVVEGDRRVPVSGTRERALLAILLIHAGEVVSADRLIDELWGSDLPANPSNALQVVVSRVRRALEVAGAAPQPGERLTTRKPGYVLHVDPDELDAARFGQLVEQARQIAATDQPRRVSLLERALSLWRGPALAEFALEEFAREEIARLEEARITAVEMKSAAELSLGRHAELVGQLKALVGSHPLRERLRGLLMLALYRSGRQGEALRVFQEGRKALVDELGVDPGPELQELHQQILLQAASLAAAPQSAVAPLSNLPAQVTSFVGRHDELKEVRKLLARSRLVTLIGAGGCGKTRLAIEAASAAGGDFPDGVWLAELEAVNDAALVPAALAAAVGIPEGASLGVSGEKSRPLMDRLIDYLRGKEALVVLDNCEHLIEACAQVAGGVLRSAPKVRFLATSRERFGVGGEALLPVPPLGVPGPRQTSLEQLAQSDAVRLFVDRATAVQPAFTLDADTAPAVCHICRRLDGIPLALELAAARVRILPPAEIAARLDDRLSLLTSGSRGALPRHRTLRAAIDWSYDLASAQERELFGRLSVFVGGFTLAAAVEVCADQGAEESDVLDLLARLVDQSLVIPGDGGNARFRMLETLRGYAGQRLTESGTADRLRRRHAEYLLRLAELAEPQLRGHGQPVWLRRLEAERDNISVAIDWALHHDPEMAVRLSSALAYFWLIGRHRSEVRRRLAEAVDTARQVSPASRARALAWAAQLACVEGRLAEAAAQAQEAYELSTEVGDPWWVAMSEMILGLARGLHGEIGQAGEFLEEARARFEEMGGEWGAALSTMLLGYVSTFAAQHERAVALAHQGLEGFRAAGDQWGQTMALELLGLLARGRGAYGDAIAVYEEALGIARDLGLRDEVPFLLVELADLSVLLGDWEAAAVLHKEALDAAEELGAMDALAHARNGLALAARRQGDYGRARELQQAALSFYQQAGFAAETVRSLASLGYVAELTGDLDDAEAYHLESLRLACDLPQESALAIALEGLACVAARRRQAARAALLLGVADSIRTRTGTALPPPERSDVERAAAAAVSELGEEAVTAMTDRGRRMTTQEAVDYATSGGPALLVRLSPVSEAQAAAICGTSR
jgi:predicted ATPase/DNA-binding SARP family transcriptional activator